MSIVEIIPVLVVAILIYTVALTVWYTVLLMAALPEVIKKFKETNYGTILEDLERKQNIPLTVVIPAYNEAKGILNTVYSLLASHYKNIKIIVVNDGSSDAMLSRLKQEFLLYETPIVIRQVINTSKILHYFQSQRFPNLVVLDKEHSPYNTSADALNAGLNACQTPIMLTMDADTMLEPEALSRILLAFLSKRHCIAVSGSVYVCDENKLEQGQLAEPRLPQKFIPALQSIEYLRSFLYSRAGLNLFVGSLCYSGDYILFETKALRDVGGFDGPNFADHAEMIMNLHQWMRKHRYPYVMRHAADSFAWKTVPTNLKGYWQQRERWQRGMWRSVFRHIKMLLNPNFGWVGMVAFPLFVLFEILSPVIELVALLIFLLGIVLQVIPYTVLFWYLFLAWGFVILVSVVMIFLDLISFHKYWRGNDTIKMIGLAFAEVLGFRQYRTCCATWATLRYIVHRLCCKAI